MKRKRWSSGQMFPEIKVGTLEEHEEALDRYLSAQP